MPYGVAPKVQGTSMAPRQAAMQRAVAKPQPAKQDRTVKHWNTDFGLKQNPGQGKNNPNYTKNPPTMAAVNVNNQPAVDPTFGPMGTTAVNGSTPGTVTVGVPAGGTGDPKLDKYLAGDDIYQSVLASLDRNRTANQAQYDYNANNYKTDADTIRRRLAAQEVKDNQLLDSDYASRGLFGSGLFAKADADLGQSYADQYTDLETNLGRNLQQLAFDQDNQNRMDEETRRQAELDAITRRAQEFGIFGGPSNSTGSGKKNKKDDKKKPGKKGGKR